MVVAATRLGAAAVSRGGAAFHLARRRVPARGGGVPAAGRWLSSTTSSGEESSKEGSSSEAAEEANEGEERVAAALAERDEFKDKWMRSLAEMENMRRIKDKDVQNARDYSVQKFAKSMLEVSDSLGYALDAARNDDASLKTLVDGVDLTKSQLVKALGEHGVVEFCRVGDKFDPNLHQALFEVDDPDNEPSTVAQVLKTGFTIRDRVLRAAQVGVVKARPSD